MKRKLIILLILFLVIGVSTIAIRLFSSPDVQNNLQRPNTRVLVGDVDGNNKVDSLDTNLISNHLSKKKLLSGDRFKRADVNNDGNVDQKDFILVKRIIAKNAKSESTKACYESTDKTKYAILERKPTGWTKVNMSLCSGCFKDASGNYRHIDGNTDRMIQKVDEKYCNPTPTPRPTPPVLMLEEKRFYLKLGSSVDLSSYLKNFTRQKVIWESSNPKVATVDENGKVTASKKYLGDTMVTIKTEDGNYSNNMRVSVTSVGISTSFWKFTINDDSSKVSFGTYNSYNYNLQSEYISCLNIAEDNYKKIEPVKKRKISKTPRTGTKVHFINVGRGDATLLEHNGHFGLIDTGLPKKSTSYLSKILGQDYKLDFVLVTHWHSDHMGNLYQLLANEFIDSDTKFYFIKNANLVDKNDEKNCHELYCNALVGMKQRINNDANLINLTNKKDYNYKISLGDDEFKIFVLGNEFPNNTYYADESTNGLLNDENRNSLGVLISYNNKNVLITGDMSEGDEYRVAAKISDLNNIISSHYVDVYKMGHHGATTASYTPLLDYIRPKDVVISNSVENIRPYGNINLNAMCYMQYEFASRLYLTSNAKNGGVVYDFSDYGMFYDGDTKNEIAANQSPLDLCNTPEKQKNGAKFIKFPNAREKVYRNGCELYLEYGNFIVGTRDNKKYDRSGGTLINKYRAPGRICN